MLKLFTDNSTLKLADTLKSKLKDTVDQLPISHDKTKDKSPTPSLKNSPKVQKKHTPLDDRPVSTREFNHEIESSSSKH